MIRAQVEAFTKMVTIFAEDDLSRQALVITPAEAEQLKVTLAALDLDNDPICEREAGHLRRLTLYNGHSLPVINRQKMRDENNMTGPEFHFELWQVIELDPPVKNKITEM